MLEVGPHVRDRIVRVEDKAQDRQGLEVVQRVGVGPQVVEAMRPSEEAGVNDGLGGWMGKYDMKNALVMVVMCSDACGEWVWSSRLKAKADAMRR